MSKSEKTFHRAADYFSANENAPDFSGDLLVEIAKNTSGVLGAGMTGGGFGGSTVNLVKRENLGKFKEKIRFEYQRLTEIKPMILVSEASEGASEINAI